MVRASLCVAGLALLSFAAHAEPPPGFKHAGQLYATSAGMAGDDVKVDRSVVLPAGTKIDTTYRQAVADPLRGGGHPLLNNSAETNLSVDMIPPGFHIECHGNTGGGKRWAVRQPYNGPILRTDASGNTIFTLGLYADTGRIGLTGGCDAVVEVYYKPAE